MNKRISQIKKNLLENVDKPTAFNILETVEVKRSFNQFFSGTLDHRNNLV